ncbi:hypothetical protein [Pedobacter sp. MW01-1-1]|uniref:hypothetical protein n=1 Tax=Pedobacter sp. MW01-1-1 TaxID=3383027 RepID=UPI003FF0E483
MGIGTLTPQAKLDVNGSTKSFNVSVGQIDMFKSTTNYANFSSNNHGSVLVSSNLFMEHNDDLKIANSHPSMSGASILIPGNGQPNQGSILFYTNTPSAVVKEQVYSGAVSMAINGTGNIGIGTTTPQEKLSVNGNIRAREIKVEATNWPDYVFEKDYKIISLSDLEKYIKINKHLPDMPSAKEVESNGLVIGELVKQQQKKIEELTLYLIEKDKEIDALKQLNMRVELIEQKLNKVNLKR